jgi:cell division protein FtsW (lipid II flippase)
MPINQESLQRIVIFILCSLSFFLALPLNSGMPQREEILFQLGEFKEYAPVLSARDYCMRALDLDFVTNYCRSSDKKYNDELHQPIRESAANEIRLALESYQSLQKILQDGQHNGAQLSELRTIIENKISLLETQLEKNQAPQAQHAALFKGLLIAQGVSYNPYSNTFKTLPYDMARYVTNQSGMKGQLERLGMLSRFLFILILAGLGLIYYFLRQKFTLNAHLVAAFFMLTLAAGLNIVRDASLHFGAESSLFQLNPFLLLLERQCQITVLSIALFLLAASQAYRLGSLLDHLAHKISVEKISLTAMGLTLLSYLALGPSLGSETFKIASCTIAAILLNRHGRTLELAQEQFGLKKLVSEATRSFFKPKKQIFNPHGEIELSRYLGYYTGKKILSQLLLMLLLLGMVAIIFSDLGGSLIAASVLVFSLFVLLGKSFAAALLIPVAVLGIGLYWLSEKVRGRFELMFEPMTANISDFARLVQFEQAGQPYGYGLGKIKWCSSEGVCVPLQSLSDYMPTLVGAWLGKVPGTVFFICFAVLLLWLTYQCFTASWFYASRYRFLKIFAALLCLASLCQLIVTVLGNWRLIPLTGLGTPLMSIGLSSSVAISIGLGLATGLCGRRENG